MKKPYFLFIFFVFFGFLVFGGTDIEEVDFLLFMPNSSNRFVDEEQAFIQLNNLAQYISNKSPGPGQISVYGYAAYAPNDIKADDLSRERALTVMEELQKRGISKELFSDPVGYGSVYLWGNNADEDDRKPNRRVRIVLSDESPIPVTQEVIKEPVVPKYTPEKTSFKFPWWIMLVLAFLLLLLLLLKGRSRKTVQKAETTDVQHQIPVTDTEPERAVTTWMVNLDEEIRFRAYELSRQRNDSGDYRDQDWYNAVYEISSWYTACGHSVYTDGGYWWASRSYNY